LKRKKRKPCYKVGGKGCQGFCDIFFTGLLIKILVLFGYQASFLKERKKILQNPKGLAFTALDADLSLLYFLFLYCCAVSICFFAESFRRAVMFLCLQAA